MTFEKKLWLWSTPSGSCCKCAASKTPVWTSTGKFGCVDYCAACWNDFIKAGFPNTSLFEQSNDDHWNDFIKTSSNTEDWTTIDKGCFSITSGEGRDEWSGTCCSCSAIGVPVWTSPKLYEDYCASC